MEDGEATTPDDPVIEPPPPPPWPPEPAITSSLEPPPMPDTLPPPAVVTVSPTEDVKVNKRRFPWLTVVVGVIALAAIVVLAMMVVAASGDKDDAEQSLAETQSALDDAEADVAESEAALAKAESDLSSTASELADSEAARSEAEAARDEHQQELDEYATASTEFLTASIVAGLDLEEDDARCLAQAAVDELGAEAMSLIASAALDGEDAGKLDDTMSAAADECGVSEDAFDDQFDSDAFAYGDDPELDALYDSCAGGDGAACDDLYLNSAAGSEYEQFAGTCGDRFEYSDTEPCDGRV
jgi:hypothetical protein